MKRREWGIYERKIIALGKKNKWFVKNYKQYHFFFSNLEDNTTLNLLISVLEVSRVNSEVKQCKQWGEKNYTKLCKYIFIFLWIVNTWIGNFDKMIHKYSIILLGAHFGNGGIDKRGVIRPPRTLCIFRTLTIIYNGIFFNG